MVGNQRLECRAEGSLEIQTGSELTKAINKLKGMGRIRSQSGAQNVAREPPLIMPGTIVEQFYNVQCLMLCIFNSSFFSLAVNNFCTCQDCQINACLFQPNMHLADF